MSKFWSKFKPFFGLVVWVVLMLCLIWLLPEPSIYTYHQAWWWHIK